MLVNFQRSAQPIKLSPGTAILAALMTVALVSAGEPVPPREQPSGPLTADVMVPQEVSFPTQDGGAVYADVYGQGDRGVVLAHGGRFTKESWKLQAPVLAESGFRVVAIDFRGRGKSHGGPGWKAPSAEGVEFDVLAAVHYLRQTGAQSVSIVGGSFGGWAAARASVKSKPGEIDRMVLLASAAIDEPERMPGAKLFITTRDDMRGGGVLRLPEIRDQYERATDPKELVILEGNAHAQFIFETDQGERLMQEILRFLSQQ